MQRRRHLLRGYAVLAIVIVVTGAMAIATLQLVASASSSAHDQVSTDLRLVARVERGLVRLIDASRSFAVNPDDLQRVRIARLQRELEPELAELVARATRLGVHELSRIEEHTDRFVGWLALTVVEGATLEAFETSLSTWRPIVREDLEAFATAAQAGGQSRSSDTQGLVRRATLGVVVLSLLALMIGAILVRNIPHRAINVRRGAEITRG
jgi:hypothetical protein